MNLNLSLDLNVSEVISPKGNMDRQPLWGDDPVDRDFEQVLQDELESDDDTKLSQTIDEESAYTAIRQYLAAAGESQDVVIPPETELVELTTNNEQAELLQLIANARSYDVAIETAPTANKAVNNAEEDPAAAIATAALATKGADKSASQSSAESPLVTSEQREEIMLVEQDTVKVPEHTAQLPAKDVAVRTGNRILTVDGQTVDDQKRLFIEEPSDGATASKKLLEPLEPTAGGKNTEIVKDGEAAKFTTAPVSNKTNQEHAAVASDMGSKTKVDMSATTEQASVLNKPEQLLSQANIPQVTKASTDSALSAAVKANTDGSDVVTLPTLADQATDAADESLTTSEVAVKNASVNNQQNASAGKIADEATKPVVTVASSGHSANQQQTVSAEQAKPPVEAAVSSISAGELIAVSHDVEAGTQSVTPSPTFSLASSGSENNQSFAEHQKQQNQQYAGQAATAQAAEQTEQPAEATVETIRTTTNSTDPVLSMPVAAQKTEPAPLLHSTAAAPVSAMSHSAQASSQVAALQSEKLETLTANLSLLEPNAATQLKDRLLYQLNNKIQSAEVKITPEDLGTVQIKVNLQQEQLSVQFVVQQTNAKELLEQQMPKLKELLQQQGLQLSESQVEQRQANDRRSGSDEKSGHRGYAANAGGEVEHAHVATVKKQSDRMVDYYA